LASAVHHLARVPEAASSFFLDAAVPHEIGLDAASDHLLCSRRLAKRAREDLVSTLRLERHLNRDTADRPEDLGSDPEEHEVATANGAASALRYQSSAAR
jgi:hypothetical protein